MVGAKRMLQAKRGLTLLEVMIAMFIFLVGIVGVLAAMPTGINSALWVIFQDASIHLAHSKFAEFRRDRVNLFAGDPQPNLTPSGGGYLPSGGSYVHGCQEPPNGSPPDADNIPFRDFAHDPGDPYQYFDDIQRYEWKVEMADIDAGNGGATAAPQAPAGFFYPTTTAAASNINLKRVSITIRMKGTTRELRFSQLMYSYGQL